MTFVSKTVKRLQGKPDRKWLIPAARYGFAVAMVAVAVLARFWLETHVGAMPMFITFYPAVIVAATIAGGMAGILATVLSVLTADYWFILPYGIGIGAPNDLVATGIFLGLGIFVSILADRMHRGRLAQAVSATQERELALLNMGTIMALDLDHRIIRWSEGNHRLYGYDAQEAQGQRTHEFLQTHFAQSLEQIHDELMAKGYWQGEATRRTKDGTDLSLALLWAMRRDNRGRPLAILEVSTDITQQKAAEESLRQQSEELAQQNEELSQQSEELSQQAEELSEQNEELQTQSEEIQAINADLTRREKILQTLVDSSRLPIGEQEVMAKICQAAVDMIGPAATGVAVCELHGGDIRILAHAGFEGAAVPERWPLKDSFVELVMQQNRTASLEDSSLRPDVKLLEIPGQPRFGAALTSPLHVKGKCIGTVSVYSSKAQQWTAEQFRLVEWLAGKCSNTLEAMRLEAEVRHGQKQNEFLANILGASSQAFGVGYPDGRLGLINKAFEQLTGYSGAELRAIDWARTLTPPEWLDIERQKLDELARTGQPVRYEKEYIRKDGTRVPIELLVGVAKDADDKPLYYYSFLTDITERKAAEEEVRRSQQLLQAVIDNSQALIYVKDLEGRILIANRPLSEAVGKNVDEIIGKTSREIISDPQVGEAHMANDRRVIETGQPITSEESALDRVFLSVKFPLRDADGRIFATGGLSTDITERKKTEAALLESDHRVRLKLQSILSPEGDIGKLELADLIDTPALQTLMDDFYTLSNFPMALIDLQGKVLVGVGWQRICTEFHRAHRELCKHCIESDTELTTGVPQGEYRLYQCKNGLWDVATPVFVGGRHLGNLFTGQFFLDNDVVDRDFFRAQARRYGLDEAGYMAALDAVPHMSREMVKTCMTFLIKLAGSLSQLSYSNVKLARLLAERDTLTQNLQHNEATLRTTVEELGRSNKDLEQFAYVASHDLQEPLRMVTAYMQLFSSKYQGLVDDKGKQYIGFAVEGATRMSQLVHDLLAYSRASRAGKGLEPIAANTALKAALANLKVTMDETQARVTYDELPTVLGNSTQLAQLFQNLIANAMKFRRKDRPCEIHIGCQNSGERYQFYVKDNGIGIAPEHHERVFQIFQRLHTREDYPGTGIGLAICKKIVERHDGRMWIESDTGQGSTFWFTLRRAEG